MPSSEKLTEHCLISHLVKGMTQLQTYQDDRPPKVTRKERQGKRREGTNRQGYKDPWLKGKNLLTGKQLVVS